MSLLSFVIFVVGASNSIDQWAFSTWVELADQQANVRLEAENGATACYEGTGFLQTAIDKGADGFEGDVRELVKRHPELRAAARPR